MLVLDPFLDVGGPIPEMSPYRSALWAFTSVPPAVEGPHRDLEELSELLRR
jgi:hypothetical protein